MGRLRVYHHRTSLDAFCCADKRSSVSMSLQANMGESNTKERYRDSEKQGE